MCSVVTETMGALSIDIMLQHNLHHNGALWSLLLFLFNYDYTLEEGGVQKSGESNQQVAPLIILSMVFHVYSDKICDDTLIMIE